MDFTRKFNIGLTMETNYAAFATFLEKYHPYIHSFYFSVPVNRYFHTRTKVWHQFLIPGKKRQFFKMLRLIQSYGVELELLFNTLRLNDEMIGSAAKLLADKGIEVDSVCFITDYYESVKRHFPDKKYVLSFNNGYQKRHQLEEALARYDFDVVVLGSAFIRNNGMFAYLKEQGKQTYLLLNNACSFNCDTCRNVQSVCESAFLENRKHFSVEYLYALQSIFPCELRDGTIDTDKITCFKISNRSSDLAFIERALDSYLHDKVDEYVAQDKDNYAIWGRAGFFWKHYAKMDLEAVKAHKTAILSRHAKGDGEGTGDAHV
jgi:hypothetical protein